MFPDLSGPPQSDVPDPVPSPELRERILDRCRQAMAARLAARRRQRRWQWGMAAGAAALLLLNAITEHQSSARMAALVSGGASIAGAPTPAAGAAGSFRTRQLLLAALLRDPNSL